MPDFITSRIRKETLRHLGIVFAENVLSRGLNFILIVLVARELGPEKYGLYSFVTVSILFLGVFLDFGMENTAVRFSGKYGDKREGIFGVYFIFKSAMLAALLFLILLYPRALALLVNKPLVEKYLLIIFIGCVMESYQYVITTYLQSLERFTARAVINAGVFLVRLVSIFVLLQMSVPDIRTVSFFFALSGLPFVLVCSGYFAGFFRSLFSYNISRDMLKEILHYAKWIAAGSVAMNIMTRLDFYVIVSFLSFREAGLYNSAFQLVSPLMVVSLVFGKVFLPKVSKYTELSRIKAYIRKAAAAGAVVSLMLILVLPFSRDVILFVFGREYSDAFGVFGILLVSYVFTLWNVMFGIAFYSMGYSKYMTMGAYVELVIFAACSFILVPRLGMEGAAWSRMIASAGYLGAVVLFMYRKIYCVNRQEGLP
ncbi:MAG: oligosaccharide flippase family protein [Deferribacteres bacterium]|nr:oligosaccharide flippase family protein [Deferribacteres bacterium]